jgi:hypothetical protein
VIRIKFEHVFELGDGQFVLANIEALQPGAVVLFGLIEATLLPVTLSLVDAIIGAYADAQRQETKEAYRPEENRS